MSRASQRFCVLPAAVVPQVPGIVATVEDPVAVTAEQRLRRFGQPDHVRIYAVNDLTRRLEAGA